MSWNQELLLWVNGFVGRYPILDAVAQLLVNEYFVPVALALGLLFLWFGGRSPERDSWQWATVVAAVSVGATNALIAISNRLYPAPRPFTQLDLDLLFYKPSDPSFPSNAAGLGFAIAGGVWLRHKRASIPFFVLAILFPVVRVFSGVHYPLDVIAGAVLGFATALLTDKALRRVEPVVARLLAALRRLGVA